MSQADSSVRDNRALITLSQNQFYRGFLHEFFCLNYLYFFSLKFYENTTNFSIENKIATLLGNPFSINEKVVSQCDDQTLGSTAEMLIIQFDQ